MFSHRIGFLSVTIFLALSTTWLEAQAAPPSAGTAEVLTTQAQPPFSATGIQVGDAYLRVTSIAAGENHTCAVLTTGGVKCWGKDSVGQLGDDVAPVNKHTPVDVLGLSSGVVSVSAGGSHTCAVLSTGAVKCWGSGWYGQLGNGEVRSSWPTPVDVVGLSEGVVSVSAGQTHTCAVLATGAAKCWGSDERGQLGAGFPRTLKPTPVDVPGLSEGVSSISAGYSHTCAVQRGAAKCWGYNEYGQLGHKADSSLPTSQNIVFGLSSGVSSISASESHTCAVLTSGAVQCWGSNQYGQVGQASRWDPQPLPVPVLGLKTGVTSVAAGWRHTCAVQSGVAKCWGEGGGGQRADGGMPVINPTPAAIAVLDAFPGVTSLTAGAFHSCVVQSGAAWCWGDDLYGQLGDDTARMQWFVPAAVFGLAPGGSRIVVAPGHFCSMAPGRAVKCVDRDKRLNLGYEWSPASILL